MIVRAFRLTDKVGNAFLKTLGWLANLVAIYVRVAGGALASLLGTIGGWLLAILGRILVGLAWIVGTIIALGQRVAGRVPAKSSGPGGGLSALRARLSGDVAEQQRLDTMLRRAEELSEAVVLVEDPLKSANRTLSAMLVVLLAAVVVLLIWATTPRAPSPASAPAAIGLAAVTSPEPQLTPFATPVPTVTPRPEALRIGGSLAYSARSNGQDDIWVSVIGFDAPIQLTNSPADDRSPAWSPDGHFVAYASHRDGNWELYVQDVRTGNAVRLTYTLSYEGAPAWSPDGQWLVYEAYAEDNLDIYITRVDGTQGPIRLTSDPAPDFDPVWAPGGREIAYVSLKGGNKDIYLLSLDDPSEDLAVNLTDTPKVDEEKPAWSPDGQSLAYFAHVDGLDVVYAKPVNSPASTAQVIDRGRDPVWAPDGDSLVYTVDQGDQTLLVAGLYQTVAMTNQAISVEGRASDPDWTAWRPQGLGNTGANAGPSPTPLYEETIVSQRDQPPFYHPILLGDVQAPLPHLSDRVNDSFTALRRAVLEQTGSDILGTLEDAFWALDRLPEPGQERLNWHMAGRAFSLNRNLIYGFPPQLEIVRVDQGPYTYWRVYARAAVQDGQLGEPLRDLPWDFTARSSGDVQAYEEGGRLRAAVPTGYYVDLTQLMADYGWQPVPADRTWRQNFGGVLFWDFVKTDGLTWEQAMLELYTQDELTSFLTDPTPFPTPTLAPPSPTPEPSRTATPIPPDVQSSEGSSG